MKNSKTHETNHMSNEPLTEGLDLETLTGLALYNS